MEQEKATIPSKLNSEIVSEIEQIAKTEQPEKIAENEFTEASEPLKEVIHKNKEVPLE